LLTIIFIFEAYFLTCVQFPEFYVLRVSRNFSQALARQNEGVRHEFSSKRIFPYPTTSRGGASLLRRGDSKVGSRKGEDPHIESTQHLSSSSSMQRSGSSSDGSHYKPSSNSPSDSNSRQILDIQSKERHESQISDPKSVDLDEIIRLQQDAVDLRRKSSERTRRKFERNVRDAKRYNEASSQFHIVHRQRWQKSIEENWRDYLATKPAEFVTSKEALSLNSEAARKGTPLFEGIRVDEHNSADMQRIFRLTFEAKIRLDQSRGTYSQFRSAVGQFLRTYLSRHNERVLQVSKSGGLFGAITELQVVRVFLGHFEVRASATTVQGKAMHLRRLADEAVSYFTEKNEQEKKGRAMSVATFLRSMHASYKTESRRKYRSQNTERSRMERGALLLPEDFSRCVNRATQELQGIMKTVQRLERKFGSNSASLQARMESWKGIAEKWNINFIGALVLSGGGQRPQVYAELELPQASEIIQFAEDCGARQRKYFSLRTGPEKTTRSIDLPAVLFPRSVLSFVQFHVEVMRPLIVKRMIAMNHEDDHETHPARTLLIHTKEGRSLESADITRTLGKFLGSVDAELAHLTTMEIRGSYASMMLRSFRSKEILVDMSEQDFLLFLAKQMNTSVEQLAMTYASCDVDGFEEIANEVMAALGPHAHREQLNESEEETPPNAAEVMWC
jgi:hypothetical protein